MLRNYEGKKASVKKWNCDILGAEAPYAARNFAHLYVVSSRQRSYGRLRCMELYT